MKKNNLSDLLNCAVSDDKFRTLLLSHPEKAAHKKGVKITTQQAELFKTMTQSSFLLFASNFGVLELLDSAGGVGC
ncbi:hypothetical protein L6Q79_11450 [bacterium]|nr:hypothetical protein [bacterium]NUN46898.1 hypothetical protein [bacterium]